MVIVLTDLLEQEVQPGGMIGTKKILLTLVSLVKLLEQVTGWKTRNVFHIQSIVAGRLWCCVVRIRMVRTNEGT